LGSREWRHVARRRDVGGGGAAVGIDEAHPLGAVDRLAGLGDQLAGLIKGDRLLDGLHFTFHQQSGISNQLFRCLLD
jgi:hypothetical protein